MSSNIQKNDFALASYRKICADASYVVALQCLSRTVTLLLKNFVSVLKHKQMHTV